jgi:hypothetical protein
MEHPIFMVIICLWYITPNDLSELTLKKKSNSVCYHAVCESVAMGESLNGHISTHDNPADICTKIIPSGMKWDHLVGLILYDLNDSHSWCSPMMVTKGLGFPCQCLTEYQDT